MNPEADLIPLVDMGVQNGGTTFLPATHLLTYREASERKIAEFQPSTNRGDAIIFAGPIFHKGGANPTLENRLVAYQV